jgi:hypothetical protein
LPEIPAVLLGFISEYKLPYRVQQWLDVFNEIIFWMFIVQIWNGYKLIEIIFVSSDCVTSYESCTLIVLISEFRK